VDPDPNTALLLLAQVMSNDLSRGFCVKILFCKHYFSLINTFMRKGKEADPEPVLEPDPDPYL
jgi:hypothetical protein